MSRGSELAASGLRSIVSIFPTCAGEAMRFCIVHTTAEEDRLEQGAWQLDAGAEQQAKGNLWARRRWNGTSGRRALMLSDWNPYGFDAMTYDWGYHETCSLRSAGGLVTKLLPV